MRFMLATLFSIAISTATTFAAEFKLVDKPASFVEAESPGNSMRTEHWISMSGQIVEGDAERLKVVLAQISAKGARGTFASTMMTMSSLGGDLDPSLELVEIIREHGIGTYLGPGATCYSGCALAFMAGRWRDGDGTWSQVRTMNATAVLGFHAPFAFASADAAHNANLDDEVKKAIIGDVERGGVDSARKLLKLTIGEPTMPASLVEELLKYESNAFLVIDDVNKAGRWNINLENEGFLKVGSVVTQEVRRALSGHCTNQIAWLTDRFAPPGLETNYLVSSLSHDGMADSCEYKLQTPTIHSKASTDNGDYEGAVVKWHTLAPETLLVDLDREGLGSAQSVDDKFADAPVSQVDGKCRDGFQWIGGWSGAYWSDSVAHATYRNCQDTKAAFVLECRHGTGVVKTWIGPGAIGRTVLPKSGIVQIQIDDGYLLDYRLDGERRGDDLALISELQRNYFTIQSLKSSHQLKLVYGGEQYVQHLSGSRRAIEAMERSCL